jgi:hypothetical protein
MMTEEQCRSNDVKQAFTRQIGAKATAALRKAGNIYGSG